MHTTFCRALYDYNAQASDRLSFKKGDVIECITRAESGWWDGILHSERGWFPSNYVTVISDEEADAIPLDGNRQPNGSSSVSDSSRNFLGE